MAARRVRQPAPRRNPVEKEIKKTVETIRDVLIILLIGFLVYNWVDYGDKKLVLTGFIFVGLLYAIFKKKF